MTAHTATIDTIPRSSLFSALQALGMLPILILLGLIFQFFSGLEQTGNFATALTDGRFISLQNLSIVAAQASINRTSCRHDVCHLNWWHRPIRRLHLSRIGNVGTDGFAGS
jgi:predicted ABC-type sugar transport system permease subunit